MRVTYVTVQNLNTQVLPMKKKDDFMIDKMRFFKINFQKPLKNVKMLVLGNLCLT